jgi:hypothetical protein
MIRRNQIETGTSMGRPSVSGDSGSKSEFDQVIYSRRRGPKLARHEPQLGHDLPDPILIDCPRSLCHS